MNPAFVLRATTNSFIAAPVAWLLVSCGPPPCPSVAGPGAAASNATVAGSGAAAVAAATPAVAKEPRAFMLTTAELFAKAKFGWNLGNSLDVPEGETAWGNPQNDPGADATPSRRRASGSCAFRSPGRSTWGRRRTSSSSRRWLRARERGRRLRARAGLYAIINVHHDGADDFKGVEWITLNDDAGQDDATRTTPPCARDSSTVWTQIAKYFAGYGEELLFESMNEIHDGYGNPDPRHFAFINELEPDVRERSCARAAATTPSAT